MSEEIHGLSPREALKKLETLARVVINPDMTSLSPDDLIGAGAIGLIQAAARFDTTVNERFSTYADHRIKGAMRDAIREHHPLRKLTLQNQNRIRGAKNALTMRLARRPEPSEIADELGVPLERYEAMRQRISAETPLYTESAPTDIDAAGGPDPEELVSEKMQIEALWRAVDELPERMRRLIRMYCDDELTLRQAGEALGVSEQRACQIKREAIEVLRERLQP